MDEIGIVDDAKSVSVANAVDAFRSLPSMTAGVDVSSLKPFERQELAAEIRHGQRMLELLLIRIAAVMADRQAE